jgi:hypothetical protein
MFSNLLLTFAENISRVIKIKIHCQRNTETTRIQVGLTLKTNHKSILLISPMVSFYL